MSIIKKVTIIDYGLGNLLSVSRAIEKCGAKPFITDNCKDVVQSDYLILPGVGNFSIAIEELRKRGLEDAILDYSLKERPLLGICLGMQMLLDTSEEQGFHSGLGIISGSVKAIPKNNEKGIRNKIPHIGWAPLSIDARTKIGDKLELEKNFSGKFFYFIHSFQGHTDNPEECIAITKYNNLNITAIIQKKYAIGCQFHPEKSGKNGIDFLKNFMGI
jgi:imidazole glycerol-phosphate synthase subunit HisH